MYSNINDSYYLSVQISKKEIKVAEKDAWDTAGSRLMGRQGHGVGIAEGAENSQVIVGQGVAEKKLVGRYVAMHAARVAIEQVCGRGQHIEPERGWCGGVKKHGMHAVIYSVQDALGTPVLLGGVWAGEAEHNVVRKQDGAHHVVVKFFAVVYLDAHDGALKLSVNKDVELNQGRQNIIFLAKRKSLGIMREIIQNIEIKLEVRVADNG
jgi:hypothetical protein